MTKIMTANEFIKRAYQAYDLPNCYVTGCFGAPLTLPGVIERWEAEYSKNLKYDELIRSRAHEAALQDMGCFGFDCVNLIKAILWGWSANISQEYGGARYQANGVPDVTVEALFNMCEDVSDDFSRIKPGAMLYYNNGSHCGIYVGDGLAIEATGSWDRKVYLTVVNNLRDAYPNEDVAQRRSWQAWGLLPWIDYKEENEMTIYADIICPCCGRTLKAGIDLTLAPGEDLLTVYTVAKGDTLWGIANKFYGNGLKWTVIAEANGITDGAISTGQLLKIPRI